MSTGIQTLPNPADSWWSCTVKLVSKKTWSVSNALQDVVHVLYRNRGSARWLIKLSLTHFSCERPWQHCSFCNLSTGPEEVFIKNSKHHTVSQFQTAANYRNCFHHNPGKGGMPIRPYFLATESGQHICHPIIPAHIRNLMSRRVTRNSNEGLQKKHSRDTVLVRRRDVGNRCRQNSFGRATVPNWAGS